jgi:hypothetical protein
MEMMRANGGSGWRDGEDPRVFRSDRRKLPFLKWTGENGTDESDNWI